MSADVMPEYKRTEVGLIPHDWEVRCLGELAIVRDGTHQTPKYQSSGVPFYSVEHVTSGDFFNTKFISELEHQFLTRSFKIEKGDILMTRIGSIGECKLIDWDVRASFYVSLALLKIRGASAEYVAQYSNSAQFKNEIELHSLQHATPKKINLGPISCIKILLPPTETEQRAIVSVLSEMDALIDRLDKLIAKKHDIQQAAMQQLLTGQRRLPGFSGQWEVKRLGDVCKITTGKKDVNEGNPSGQFPFFTCAREHTYSDYYSFDCEAILVAGNGEVGNLNYYSGKFEAYQRTYVIYGFNAETKYIWHALKFGLAASLGIGKIGSSIPYIKKSELTSFKLHLPSKDEQSAIATAISDMSTEITILGTSRDKAHKIKQGMMQELLTGRTRLV